MKNTKLLTAKEASELLNVKVSRIRTAVFRGEIPTVKIGRLVRFKSEDIESWISKNTINQPITKNLGGKNV